MDKILEAYEKTIVEKMSPNKKIEHTAQEIMKALIKTGFVDDKVKPKDRIAMNTIVPLLEDLYFSHKL